MSLRDGCANADIVLQCSFNSQSHFSKHFKDAIGMTPSNYRKD
ncbi:MAG: helix-turn-helix domain-containing protein [Cyanobacteria bacterium P01_H01_bin.119]